MDNIEELSCYSIKTNIEDPEAQVVFDYAEGLVCAISNQSLLIYEENDNIKNVVVHKIKTSNTLKYIKYVTIYNVIFLATENELMLYDIESRKIITTRDTEKPIVELSWNHLETLLVVIDTDNNITSYTCTKNFIDLKSKVHLSAKVPVPVLVGWGSQNTQFQGPNHKRVADVSIEATEPALKASPKISWRGNSELFVVNYYQDDQRLLKVFDSELHPLNQSEPYKNLQESVAFMGQGQCIACCAHKNGGNQLVIFEKNCKVKAEFEFSEIKGSIIKLLYHPIMNMLAIGFVDKDENSFINIYLYSNGEWFLKQQLNYPTERKLHDFKWLYLQENLFTTCKMIIFTSQDVEYRYFRFTITRCPLTATVVVVNGRNLEFYLFDKQITPPPMYYSNYMHTRTVNRVLFHPTRKLCIIIDSFLHITLLNLTEDGKIELYGTVGNYSFRGIAKYLSVNWTDTDIELIIANETGIDSIITKIKDLSVTVKTEENCMNIIVPYNDTNLLESPAYLEYGNKYIYLTKHEVEHNGVVSEYEFALSSTRELYVNDNVVCDGVTSLYIFGGYLIFTHSSAQLYCIRLKDHDIYTSPIFLTKIFNRDIEQGGIIVTCTNLLFPQIILQMPRGNIETIGCKLITIDVVENMLKDNRWAEVLHILRTEKVNSNVIIDLNPRRFREHIPDFVQAAKNNTMLTNIVTEFNIKENCFQTFYKNYSPNEVSRLQYDKKSIVEDILKYLITTDCITNLPIIVAIQQKHISLKSALKSIKDIYDSDRGRNEQTCSKAIKQLMVQEHFKDIENAAYTLFDLDFLTLIYYNSSEDPKVYEPEIRNFRTMGPIERRFKMSIRGRNLKGSVKYLLRSDTVDESFITNFIIKNRLEDVAYFSVKEFHKHFELVTDLYSTRLSILKKHAEAGMLLKRAGMYKEALQEYKKGLEWREVISLCSLLQLTEEESKKIYKDIAADLVKENHVDDAVLVLENVCKEHRAAIDVLVTHNAFRKAICLAETYRESSLIEEEILPKLKQYMFELKDKIDKLRYKFEEYANRLIVVWEERASKLHAMAIGYYDENDDDLYSQSETSSRSSRASRQTSKSRLSTLSSRNRRKEERKKVDLKHGGFYEDIALMRVLHNMYNEVFDFGMEVRELCLISYQNLEQSEQVHKQLSALHDDMIKRIPEIWSDTFINEENSNEYVLAAVTQNKKDLDPLYSVPPSIQEAVKWKLEMFSG